MFGFGGTPKQGKIKELNDDSEFNSELSSAGDKLVVVDFFATWCGPCQQIAPELARLSEEYTNVVFLKVDVDKLQDLAAQCSVSAMPTFHFYKNQSKIEELRGANVAELQRLIQQHATKPAFSGQGRTLGSAPAGFQPYTMQAQSPEPKQESKAPKEKKPETSKEKKPETLKDQDLSENESPQPMQVDTSDKIVSSDDPEGKEPSVDEEQLEQLLSMDFSRVRAVKALYYSQNSGIEEAINWLMEHQEDKDIDQPLKVKELTPEEKEQREREAKEKAKKLQRETREKIKQKEKMAELEREKRRRMEGKQVGEMKKEVEDIKRKKEMEEKKRQRMEDKRARQRIKALLEQDKKERRAQKNANHDDSSSNKSAASASASKPAPKPAAARNQDKCVIQFRLFDGSTCRNRFKPEDTMSDVFDWLKQNKNVQSFTLTLPGENRTFSSNDNMTLREADLVPRAQLTLTKQT